MSESTIERDLILHMLGSDLALAKRMAELGDLALCRRSLDSAAQRINQLEALTGHGPLPISQPPIDV